LLDKMTCKELLELKRIKYISVKIFDNDMNLISSNSVVETIIAE
jgi:hypothetical protein